MMGRAAAYDMARSERVQSVTLADNDERRLKLAVEEVNRLAGSDKVRGVKVDGADAGAALDVMRGHDGVLSAIPYFYNLGLVKAAIRAGCHFADLGGNNTVGRIARFFGTLNSQTPAMFDSKWTQDRFLITGPMLFLMACAVAVFFRHLVFRKEQSIPEIPSEN